MWTMQHDEIEVHIEIRTTNIVTENIKQIRVACSAVYTGIPDKCTFCTNIKKATPTHLASIV